MKQTLYHLQALSALHVGVGQGTGVIDLPIDREKASNLPQVPGSAIKGVLRDELRSQYSKDDQTALFGPETGEAASEHAGALAVGDARLLCLPIRSWCGTFAWATCPMVLRRYQRGLESTMTIPEPANTTALHVKETFLKDGQRINTCLLDGEKIYLEDLDLSATHCEDATTWAEHISQALFQEKDWQILFQQRFIVLPDNLFDFLAETATEIRARIRIEEGTRTVQSGALWYEEYLPAETLLWGCIGADRSRKPGYLKTSQEMLDLLPAVERLQIGGNATIGAGQAKWNLYAKNKG